uniref:THO complex subunit 6 n=1 Tax=Plectus sambesii TaxID=2011161 RepID=A0A914VQ27_9BILA
MGSMNALKRHYCRLFDQAYSPDGKFLVVADGYGRLTTFDLDDCLSNSYTDTRPRLPAFHLTHKNHGTPRESKLYALASNDNHLICGDSHGDVFGYSWQDLSEQGTNSKPSFRYVATSCVESVPGPYEVNALAVSDDGERLISGGAGDNAVKVWSLENGRLIHSFTGHSDYIHDVALRSEHEMASASEDGTVRLWDTRVNGCVHTLKPADNQDCARNALGSWLGCVAVDGEWLVCGGGPALAIWHLSSMSMAQVLSTGADVEHHAVELCDNKILAGGSQPRLFQWTYRGESITDVGCSSNIIYDIAANTNGRNHITTCCGSSSKVDVFINLGYKSFSLETMP